MSILDDLHPDLFVPTTQVPDRLAPQLEAVRHVLNNRLRIRHREKGTCPTGYPLLRAAVMHKPLQVRQILSR